MVYLHIFPEMQCCDKLSLESVGGVVECHPYVLGHYRKIGECNGRSFYQHNNNTDIFFYHACGAWYVGLQVGHKMIEAKSLNSINLNSVNDKIISLYRKMDF